ncbi:MAG: hypothetical protein M3347_12545 [Armatimonadota bacterium]|nr:hypothetical protein [Armatimonadota bacterium]
MNRFSSRAISIILVTALASSVAASPSLPMFDFTKPQDVQGWQPTHDIASIEGSAEGLVITISGPDPYAIGPARDFPRDTPLWLHARLKSAQAGTAQIFYFNDHPTEANSVRFGVEAGVWKEARLPLPALGPGYRFRIDPPGTGGQAIINSLRFEPRLLLKEPEWPRPTAPVLNTPAFSLQSGDLKLVHGPGAMGDFELQVADKRMAVGFTRPLIGYAINEKVQWLDLAMTKHTVERKQTDAGMQIVTKFRDEDGANWEIMQRFNSVRLPGTIEVETRVTVDQDRSVLFLPMLMVLPGVGSFGEAKGQGLFAGLEYLENEPSSSEADIIGPASKRQVPDSVKITLPLMAIQHDDRYIGLVWRNTRDFSAVFDSPDRLFKSGGHVMGIIFPGSNGENRVGGNLLPYQGELLAANKPLILHASLIGGQGQSVIPAVQHYVESQGLPPKPNEDMDYQDYSMLAAAGWLDSKIREGNLYRHAYWPGFNPHPAADAAVLMEWLATQTRDAQLAGRLKQAAKDAIAQVKPADYNYANVSHVTYPVNCLIYGHVAENAARAEQQALDLLKRFELDGTVRYRPKASGPDYGKTHFEPTANGLTAQVVASLLEAASFSGNRELIEEGLKKLRALDRFANTVPRGAQTWEVPLHTPDILASAHLVRAYTRGYELTGDRHFLDQARYWAWTGVPFVYLVNPTMKGVGPFSTIAVLGATNWQAPVWFGQPVQWCGLVYADALYRLARHDPDSPWQSLARGITGTGIQHTWPLSDPERKGLLPDFYHLRDQRSDGPAISPGTLQTNAIRLFDKPVLYDFRALRTSGLLVHTPGAITEVQDETGRARFTVHGWLDRPYYVLINGFKKTPRVRINGRETALNDPHQFIEAKGQLILQVQNSVPIQIDLD